MRSAPGGAVEANFDGLVGPTHNYAGLARGNLAAAANREQVSNPRAAALQGLAKMRALADRGIAQAVLPPHERPAVGALRRLGFTGRDDEVIGRAAREAPRLLSACSSAAAMWVANAATVSPAANTADRRVHFTPANLASHGHRAFEARTTSTILRSVFADPAHFVHHEPLPAASEFHDEGAANHTRLGEQAGMAGVELFVYGREGFSTTTVATRYAARQTLEASQAVARLHGLAQKRTLFARQDPCAIDAGVFHNDVIAVGSRNVMLVHEHAWVDTPVVLESLRRALDPVPLVAVVVSDRDVPLARAVSTYLFNSQLIARADGSMLLVAPEDVRRDPAVASFVDSLLGNAGPIAETLFLDLRESMRNGGGPACLRLRVELESAARAAVAPGVWLTPALHEALTAWVEAHYRDRLAPADLADPALLDESRRALDRLTTLLGLPALYDFQR